MMATVLVHSAVNCWFTPNGSVGTAGNATTMGRQRCIWAECENLMATEVFLPVCLKHGLIIKSRVEALLEMTSPTEKFTPPVSEHGLVYYLMVAPTVVKIGTTRNLYQRLSTLRTDLQYVVAVEYGYTELERQRHRQFASERIGRRENFNLSDRLKRHIESLQPLRDQTLERFG